MSDDIYTLEDAEEDIDRVQEACSDMIVLNTRAEKGACSAWVTLELDRPPFSESEHDHFWLRRRPAGWEAWLKIDGAYQTADTEHQMRYINQKDRWYDGPLEALSSAMDTIEEQIEWRREHINQMNVVLDAVG